MPRRKRSMTLKRYVNSVMLLLAAACTTYPGKGDARLESIYMFAGTDGAMAYSIDKSGANLPEEYAPWRFEGEVSTSGPTFQAGTDKRALEEVKAEGYVVIVWSMTFEEETTQ